MEIKDLDKLLAQALGNDKKIASYKAYNLIGPGENYGSVMLGVDIKVKNLDRHEEASEEDLHLVAKMCPPTEFIMKIFNIPVTFKKEAGIYSTVLPTLQEFQRERGVEEVINFLPKYYGSRFSLDLNSDAVDGNACLLLENLKIKGYNVGNRIQGFDLKTAEYIIKDLATFHAVPLALKLTHPERFQKKIQPYLVKHVTEETLSDELCMGLVRTTLDCASNNLEYHKYLDRIEERMLINIKNFKDLSPEGREPFATITHNDLWVNNFLLKYKDGKPIANAVVDFQMVNYGNPATDLIFFIYSSLSNEIITENYKRLVDLYHSTFIGVLIKLGVNTEPFGLEAFLTEMDLAAKEREFLHIMFMLKPILAEKDKAKELSDMDEDEFLDTGDVSELYFERFGFVIEDFVDKGWL